MYSKYIMEEIFLFIICVLLFIALTPGIIIKPPKYYKHFFIFGHCLIFTILYIFSRKRLLNNNIEGMEMHSDFTEDEIEKCDNIHNSFVDYLETIPKEEVEKMNETDFDNKIREIIPNLSNEELLKYKQYENEITSNKDLNSIAKYYKSDVVKRITDDFEVKLLAAEENCSPDKIVFISELTAEQTNSLQGIIKSLSIEETKKLLNLENVKILEILDKVHDEY